MSLTCISCKLLFSVPQLHQEHYKSDWHRYNLKRRFAELPSLSQEDYEKRSAAFKADSEEDKSEKTSLHCETCNKYFSTQNALYSHVKSKKHAEMVTRVATEPKKQFAAKVLQESVKVGEAAKEDDAEMEDDDCSGEEGEWESCDDDDDEDPEKRVVIDTDDCLFCNHHSDSAVGNVTHMTEAHSFFIPDVEYLANLDGLIANLAAKIHLYYVCLWCDGKGKGFHSVQSVQKHMIDKGHCKMLYEGEAMLYYADCYDYSALEDAKDNEVDIIKDLLENSDYELVLPSGATIGHRSLSIYYKQNLKPMESDSQQKVRKVMQQYKSLGYVGCTGQVAIRKARDISFLRRIKDRYNLKLSVKKNKLQPHFRRQVMF